MNARCSGTFFEYCIFSSIRANPYDNYTRNKFSNLLSTEPNIYNLQNIIKNRDIKYVQLLTDNKGRDNITADMLLHLENGDLVGLSCKKNNMSIKHPCPYGLYRFLNSEYQEVFSNTYSSINNKWYNVMQPYELFNKVPPTMKQDMLNEVVDLVSANINKSYIQFLLSQSIIKESYILHCNKNKQLNMYQVNNVDINDFNITHNNHWIYINVSNNIDIKMRLHTASSRILPTLKLKFDTKLVKSSGYMIKV